jgi:hypothetical protein
MVPQHAGTLLARSNVHDGRPDVSVSESGMRMRSHSNQAIYRVQYKSQMFLRLGNEETVQQTCFAKPESGLEFFASVKNNREQAS